MITFLGWLVFVVGLVSIAAGIALLVYMIFIGKAKAQSQCPYCTQVWRDETIFLEFWHDKVSFPLHIRDKHKERHRWYMDDLHAFGWKIAREMQRERIKNGLEPKLAGNVRAYWEPEYEDEDED